jgi:SAM-dependent methyltransferase
MDLIKYFKEEWKPNYSHFELSGYALVDLIRDDETILDVGCGYNLFKPIFQKRLWGIDPANDRADEVVSIEDFDPAGEQWDVIFALGSINFGDEANINNQIRKMLQSLKAGGRIYWRQNPGIGDHPWKGVEEIDFFPWSFDRNQIIAHRHGCEVLELEWDSSNRIYAVWKKDET